jgi:signal transduction histidine kinase
MTAVRRLVPYSGAQIALPHDQQRRAESAVATARTFIAACALAAIWVAAPASEPYAQVSYSLLVGYVVFSLAIVVFLHFTPKHWPVFALALHVVDVGVAAAVTFLTVGINSPFFVLYLFTLLAAAYRWGFAETIATACAAVSLLVIETVVVALMPDLGAFSQVPPDRLIMRASYLLLAGGLTGYLAHHEKQFRAEATAITAILSRTDVRAGLKRTMASAFDALLRLFDAKRAVLVVREHGADQVSLWEAVRSDDGGAQVHSVRLEPDALPAFMFEPDAAAWHVVRRSRGDRTDIVAVDRDGKRQLAESWSFPAEFLERVGPFDSLIAIGVELGTEWTGRLFLVDPVVGRDRYSMLGFGRRLVRQIAPAIQNVHAIHRLRAAACAIERGRIARELHDGVIQTVAGVEVQMAALKLRLADQSPVVADELTKMNAALRQEVHRLRDMMQQMRPLELDPDKLVDALADFVQRFQRETGIAARFVTQLDRVALPPRACREMARIVQEALVNVRRHSGARNVFVRLSTVNGDCRLSIDDDGCGFPFSGRLSQADLDAARKGPLVINERVRLLGGALTVESDPGRGARLEIAVPLSYHASR